MARTASGPITQSQTDEVSRQALLAIVADQLGVDIRASLPGGGVSGRTASGTITEKPAPVTSSYGGETMPRNPQIQAPTEKAPASSATVQPPEQKLRKLKPGELDKSPTILAKYSAPNDIIATVDANGQLSLSNTAANTGAKVIQINKEQSDIQAQMDAITKEADINTREALLGKFHADQVEQQTQELTKFRAKAELQLGITQLRSQLAASRTRDQASPNYRLFNGMDSPVTEHIRQMLQQSESKVEKVTQELAGADPNFNRKSTEITDFIKMQQKQISQMLLRQSQTDQKMGQREEIKAEKVDAATSVMTDIGVGIVQARNPELASSLEATKIQAYNLMNSPATKLEAQKLFAMPDNLSLYQAAAMGATMADPYIAKKQQELTGDSPDKTLSELKQIRTMVSPAGETLFDQYMKQYGTKKMKEEWANQKVTRMVASKTAEGRHQQQLQMLGNAIFLKSKEKEAEFYNKVNGWKPINGKSLYDLPEVAKLLETNKSVSMEELFQTYVGNASKDLKAARRQELQDIAVGNIKSLNAGMLGQITREDDLKNKMDYYMLESRFNDINSPTYVNKHMLSL